jgi:hypothetical protein
MATIQASFANAAEFFNSLLGAPFRESLEMDKSQVHAKSDGRRRGEMQDAFLFVLLFAWSFQECDLRANLGPTTRERLGARVAADERLVRQLEQSSA